MNPGAITINPRGEIGRARNRTSDSGPLFSSPVYYRLSIGSRLKTYPKEIKTHRETDRELCCSQVLSATD